VSPHKHPANIARHDQRGFGQKAADGVAAAIGSWRFILVQTTLIIGWVALNVTAVVHHWDPYPFILLNLAFSTQAAYAAPFLQLSQNRQAEHDRAKAEADYETNTTALAEIRANTELTAQVHDLTARVAELVEQLHGRTTAQ
jgi:uncharacterized membrane protein